jgi:hypothetical protein
MDEITGGSATHLGNSVAHTAERVAAFVRSADREAYEREMASPERLAAERKRQQEQEAAAHEARRLADQLAKQAQDAIDIQNRVLVITKEGLRLRPNIISGKWEHVWE